MIPLPIWHAEPQLGFLTSAHLRTRVLRRGSLHLYALRRAKAGGAEGIRTPDPHNAIVVLYQLSYDPNQFFANSLLRKSFGDDSSFLMALPYLTPASAANAHTQSQVNSVKLP